MRLNYRQVFLTGLTCLSLSSCASSPMIQPQINSLVVAERYETAVDLLAQNRQSYGPQNDLLYFLDYAMVLHIAGQYEESIKYFKKAKAKYDQLYTLSVSKKAKTWLVNDNVDDYRGEDFERVLINVFQVLNYIKIDNYEGALVEARDVNLTLQAINQDYPQQTGGLYQEDAFARFLMGMIYLQQPGRQNIDDAYISLNQAAQVYSEIYQPQFGVQVPDMLKEDLTAAAHILSRPAGEFKVARYKALPERQNKAEVIFVHYQGLSPIKHQADIPVPTPDGFVSRITFPVYQDRRVPFGDEGFIVKKDDQVVQRVDTQCVEDIHQLAIESLRQKKLRVISKAVLRAGAKQMALRGIEANIRKSSGDTAADVVKVAGGLYSVFSEQADIRSWQTLPARINMARVFLSPGHYDFLLGEEQLEGRTVAAGEVYYIIHRSTQ